MVSLLKEQELGEIGQLLDRPWWRRAWIVQETILARSALVICGPDEVAWERIKAVIQPRARFELTRNISVPPEYPFPDEEFPVLDRLQGAWRGGNWTVTLYELLYNFRCFQCTDPRDRIYAFLGLASKVEELELVPEYGISTDVVFV